MDTVFSGVCCQRRLTGDPYAVVGIQRMGGGCDGVSAARDDKIILADDAVSGRGNYGKCPAPVESKILLGKDNRINIIFINGTECTAVGECVFTAIR